MKINSIEQQNIKQIQPRIDGNNPIKEGKVYNYKPNFTGGFDMFLRFLDTNQAWGANAVDLFCMVLPRTLTDFTRGPEAGMETMRREGMGTTNHSSVGLYGAMAGLALAAGINRAYKFGETELRANKIFADTETINMQGELFTNILQKKQSNSLNEFLRQVLERYEVKNEHGEWIKFKKSDIEKAATLLEKEIRADRNKMTKQASYNIRSILMSSVGGAENNYRIAAKAGEKEHTSRYTIDYVVENLYKLPKIFNSKNVKKTFYNTSDYAQNAFLKALKSMNIKRSIIGIGIASAVGISTQPLNMYLTRRKNGTSGFVGGGEEDKSPKFKVKKSLVAALFGAGVLSTIGNPKNIIKDIQFKGFTPTIKQFKFVYGITIMSRFLSSRNDNELREATIKDTLGFASWLILGNFVQKLVAQAFDKSLIKTDGKGIINWIKNSSLKSRDEILHEALGKNVFKNGKALSFKEMMQAVSNNKTAKKYLNILTLAQLAGYTYSALALGIGIPRLNIFITKKVMNKKAKQQPEIQNNNSNLEFNKRLLGEKIINQ